MRHVSADVTNQASNAIKYHERLHFTDHAPYLRHLLKLDNLPLICKHVSGQVLQAHYLIATGEANFK